MRYPLWVTYVLKTPITPTLTTPTHTQAVVISTFTNRIAQGPFSMGKNELDGDPLAAFGGIKGIPRADNTKYFSEQVKGGYVKWSTLVADTNGAVQVSISRTYHCTLTPTVKGEPFSGLESACAEPKFHACTGIPRVGGWRFDRE